MLFRSALAYPIGWIIDRWGGFRVVVLMFLGQVACFILAMNVHDKMGLMILGVATTIIAPLYQGADMMIYKAAHPKDVGSYTSSNSAIRNAFRAMQALVSGWVIYWAGSDYRMGFIIGIVVSAAGMAMFIIHHQIMRRERAGTRESAAPESDAATVLNANP